jgi:23S rRNA (cytidine1920-2'-O)/16S rRNA (cytidine1409-2'-O)-methyltransferase
VARRLRLDAELVRRGMARSRAQAASLIASGRVEVRGLKATKAATGVDGDTPVRVVDGNAREYVSRGGYKLAGALAALPGIEVAGRRCLDAGASTGGFTDVLLRREAAEVVAVDVGYGQLAWSLRTDPRVRVVDRTNVRSLTPEQIGGRVGLTVVDVSFISLGVVLPALVACTADDGDLLPMVKPQFEVGRESLGSGGVVRDPALRSGAVVAVAERAAELGWGAAGVARSPLPGPSGNVEFFLWLRRDVLRSDRALDRSAIEREVHREVDTVASRDIGPDRDAAPDTAKERS